MAEEKDKDPTEAALHHLRQLGRASPPPALLQRIEAGLREARVVAMADWRKVAAAAVLITGLNVAGLIYYQDQQADNSLTEADVALVNDYQLYD